NGDGVLDLVVLKEMYPSSGLTVLLGNGDGSFGLPLPTTLAGSYDGFLTVADFNADGRSDAAVVDDNSSTVSVFLNDGHWSLDDQPSVSVGDVKVFEGNTGAVNANFTVTLSHATNVDVTVNYATADISATAGSDYSAVSGVVTIPAGQASAT